ncbi:hypothetical protein TNCT_505511 [Trichonephila clavata]|uniref:Uncharacterized protein n=1 Tax=Trichonephila clavata TaxID=2740835 RepID=A0A8X6GDW8_TRICU|nr:hypothetical protein TNCT_505511 [Trichonephila clavata]
MKLMTGSMLPLTASRPRLEHRTLAVPLSFLAGILIGIPLTYFVVFLSWMDIQHISHRTYVDNRPFIPGRFGFPHGPIASLFRIPAMNHENVPKKSNPAKDLPVFSSLLVKSERKHGINPSDSTISSIGNSNTESANTSRPLKLDDVVDGIYWTAFSERLVPRGFDEYDIKLWKRFLNTTDVLKIEEGCGRMQNRLVTLAEGGKSCCRYRHNNDQIQGEIFSFYLGRLLGLRNLSPSALALVDPKTKRWSSAASQIALAQWSSERPVVLTQFVENLQPAYIPQHFREKDKRRLHPIVQDLGNLTATDISELVQWSDLVVFDYLTANLDRVVNNLFNERWNPGMMKQPTHNLAKTPEGLLLFLDNESGLLHGYRLLEKYEHFHRALLDGLCIFKRDTIEAVDKLHSGSVELLLKKSFLDSDPGMFDWLPFLPERSLKTLKKRIAHVLEHVRTCKSRYAPELAVLEAPITSL